MPQQTLNATTHGEVRTRANDNFTELYAHAASTANPHSVTKAQVGLGNVDNTSDANKPVSTAQQAAINAAVVGLLDFKGDQDCSGNPNYPVGLKGDSYVVTVAGKIGGASGVTVEVGDMIVCKLDNAGGTQASVGASWFVVERNVVGALIAANNLSDVANAATARTNLGAQAALVSGTNLKTINSQSLLGSGDLSIAAYHADVIAFRDRVITAGGGVDAATLSALDRFINTGILEGWYAKCLEIYPFVGNGLAAALQKLKFTTQAALTNVSGLFISSHYSQALGFGPYAVVANAQLQTGFVPNANGVTNSTAFLFVASTDTVPAGDSGGVVGDVGPNAAEGDWYYRVDSPIIGVGKTTDLSTLNQQARVLGCAAYSGSSRGFIDGVQLTQGNAANGTWDKQVVLFRSSRYGATYGQLGKIGCVVIGGNATLSAAEGSGLARAMRQLQVDCGRINFRENTMLLIGDSISAGQGDVNSYGLQAGRNNGLIVQNVAVPSTAVGFAQFPFTAASTQAANYAMEKPATCVVMYGTNDIVGGRSAAEYGAAMDTLVAALVAAKKRVIVCGLPFNTTASGSAIRDYYTQLNTVCRNNKVPLVDMDRAIRDKATSEPGVYMADANHPNAVGHLLLAQRATLAFRGKLLRELSLDFGSMAAGATVTQAVEMLTVNPGQNVSIPRPAGLNAGLIISGQVSSADTITVSVTNATTGTIDPAAVIVQIYVDIEV